MCKPMLVTLPFVMLLLDWWPLNRIERGCDARTRLSALRCALILGYKPAEDLLEALDARR